MDDGWPWTRRYVMGSLANWAAFLFAIYLLARAAAGDGLSAPVVWACALALAVSVAAQFVAAYRLIARQDEFVRWITAKRMIAAAGLTITIAVLWGVAEQFLALPDAPLWVVYPFFWGAIGLVTPFIRDSRL